MRDEGLSRGQGSRGESGGGLESSGGRGLDGTGWGIAMENGPGAVKLAPHRLAQLRAFPLGSGTLGIQWRGRVDLGKIQQSLVDRELAGAARSVRWGYVMHHVVPFLSGIL